MFLLSISENVSLKSANCLIWGTSQVALAIENLAANAGDVRDSVQSLGWQDPLEEGMATHSSIPAWIIPWTEEPSGPWSIESQRVGHDWSNLKCTHPKRFYRSSWPHIAFYNLGNWGSRDSMTCPKLQSQYWLWISSLPAPLFFLL